MFLHMVGADDPLAFLGLGALDLERQHKIVRRLNAVYDALGVMPDLVMASDTVISKLLSFGHVVGQTHLQLHLTAARAVCDDVGRCSSRAMAGGGFIPGRQAERSGRLWRAVLLHDPLGELLEKAAVLDADGIHLAVLPGG